MLIVVQRGGRISCNKRCVTFGADCTQHFKWFCSLIYSLSDMFKFSYRSHRHTTLHTRCISNNLTSVSYLERHEKFIIQVMLSLTVHITSLNRFCLYPSQMIYSPDWRIRVPQVDDSPHVGAEPHGGPRVGLVLPDKYGVRDGQESHQSAVLKEPVNRKHLNLACNAS